MNPLPVRRQIEQYLGEEFEEDTAAAETPVTPSLELKIRSEDLVLREKPLQGLTDLLDVHKLLALNIKYTSLIKDIERTRKEEYNDRTSDCTLSISVFVGGFGGAYIGGQSVGYTLNQISGYDTPYMWLGIPAFLIITLASGLIGAFGAITVGDKLEQRIKHRPKKKQFEEDKKIKLEQFSQEKEDLEQKLSQYNKNPAQNAVVLFKSSSEIGYSLGYVDSLEVDNITVRQEYEIEQANICERRASKHKVKPTELYVLSPAHELSEDDLKATKGKTPLFVDNNGIQKFGFAKMEGNTLKLYTDADCKFLSYTCTQEELSTAVVKKLIPKLNENHPQYPYR